MVRHAGGREPTDRAQNITKRCKRLEKKPLAAACSSLDLIAIAMGNSGALEAWRQWAGWVKVLIDPTEDFLPGEHGEARGQQLFRELEKQDSCTLWQLIADRQGCQGVAGALYACVPCLGLPGLAEWPVDPSTTYPPAP